METADRGTEISEQPSVLMDLDLDDLDLDQDLDLDLNLDLDFDFDLVSATGLCTKPLSVLSLLLILLSPTPAHADKDKPIVTVAMDARAIPDAPYKQMGLLDLQRKLALRLTQAGYGVVGPNKSPCVRILMSAQKDRLVLAIRAAGSEGLSREVVRGEGKVETFHLEVIHRAVSLVRQAERALPKPEPKPAPKPASQPASKPASRPVSKPVSKPAGPRRQKTEQPWHLELSGGAMALYRPDGVDPMIRGGARIGIWRGLGIRGMVGVSLSLPEDLIIVELAFQGGLSWRFDLTPLLYFEPGLLAGFSQHIYQMDGASDPSGLRWGFLTNLSLELGWQPHERVALRLWVSPGANLPTYPHELNGAQIWSRSWFRLEAGLMGVLVLR